MRVLPNCFAAWYRPLLFCLLGLLLAPAVSAQCNVELFMERSMKDVEGFIYDKSFRIDGKKGARPRIEFLAVLNRDTNYRFVINSGNSAEDSESSNANGLRMTIYDQQRNPVLTNFINEKFFSAIDYKCGATGLYTIAFTFSKESRSFCGAAVMAFRR